MKAKTNGAPDEVLARLPGFIGGTNLLLGALATKARKNQSDKKSNKWLIWEIISIAVICLTIIPSLFNGLWYLHPISFLFVPIAIMIGYYLAWHKPTPKNEKTWLEPG